jgi:chromosome segregation ATPase
VTTAYSSLIAAVQQRRQQLDRRAGQFEQLQLQIAAAENELAAARAASALHARVTGLLTSIGEEAQETARGKVEGLATRALQVVFGEELSFILKPGDRAGQAALEMLIRSVYGETVVETPVLDARGGGMAAVVGFVLRLVVLLLTPGVRRLLLLDETFAHVSASYEARVAEFLREVADKAGVQILLVTHSDSYGQYADVAIRLELGPDGVTRITEGADENG